MELRKIIKNTIRKYLNENIQLKPISNIRTFNFLRPRKYSIDIGMSSIREFFGKNGFRYYIINEPNEDIFNVIDADDLDGQLEKNMPILPKYIGRAVFNNNNKEYFTGYEESESIKVEKEHRRNGVATAIIKFAEEKYDKPYKPTNLLSKDMQGFVKSYGNILKESKQKFCGDCFDSAYDFMMEHGYKNENLKLVHGIVSGRGDLMGKRFTHAWCEDNENVFDYSNGREIEINKIIYYAIGNINSNQGRYYNFNDTIEMSIKYGNKGPWEIENKYYIAGWD